MAINTPPFSVQLLDQNGRVSHIWHRYFIEVQRAVNSLINTETISDSGGGGSNSTYAIEALATKSMMEHGSSGVQVLEDAIEELFSSGATPVATTERTTLITDSDSPYTVLYSDLIIFADTSSAVITVNLPEGIEGAHYKIINCGGYALTVDPNGTEELYGSGAGVSSVLSDGEVIDIHFNSTKGWY